MMPFILAGQRGRWQREKISHAHQCFSTNWNVIVPRPFRLFWNWGELRHLSLYSCILFFAIESTKITAGLINMHTLMSNNVLLFLTAGCVWKKD